MKRLLSSLFVATKHNESVNGFPPLSQNYVGVLENPYNLSFPKDTLCDEYDSKKIPQSKDYLNLLYGLKYAKTGECSHTVDFS